MSDPIILSQLRDKRAEVEAEIARLDARTAEARANLIHIASVIRLFDPKAPDAQPRAYQAVSKAMKCSRLLDLCEAALRSYQEPLDTRQLGQQVIAAEGWDAEDRTLRITVSRRIGLMLAKCERRGMVKRVGERDRATVWRLAWLPVGQALSPQCCGNAVEDRTAFIPDTACHLALVTVLRIAEQHLGQDPERFDPSRFRAVAPMAVLIAGRVGAVREIEEKDRHRPGSGRRGRVPFEDSSDITRTGEGCSPGKAGNVRLRALREG